MGKIKEFVEKVFDDYRNNRITLKQLVVSLCSCADRNIAYQHLGNIFEDEVSRQFSDIGEIAC